MLEFCLGSRPVFAHRANHNRRSIRAASCGTATLGCAAPAPGDIRPPGNASTNSLSRGTGALSGAALDNSPEIKTYEIYRLKVHLESTLTEKHDTGTVGWNLAPLSAHRINRECPVDAGYPIRVPFPF